MNTSRITLIAILITISCSAAMAQGSGSAIPLLGAASSERIDVAVRNYEMGLASGNDGLVDMGGFAALTNIAGDLLLNYNQSLASLDGLQNLATAGGLTITNNPQLGNATAYAFAAGVAVSGNVTIGGNGD